MPELARATSIFLDLYQLRPARPELLAEVERELCDAKTLPRCRLVTERIERGRRVED